MNVIGYFVGVDPAACLVQDGRLVAYVEEERPIRYKHASEIFPIRSIDYCLKQAGLGLGDVDYFAYGWDVPRYSNGSMRAFFDRVNLQYPPDQATLDQAIELDTDGGRRDAKLARQIRNAHPARPCQVAGSSQREEHLELGHRQIDFQPGLRLDRSGGATERKLQLEDLVDQGRATVGTDHQRLGEFVSYHLIS